MDSTGENPFSACETTLDKRFKAFFISFIVKYQLISFNLFLCTLMGLYEAAHILLAHTGNCLL